MGQEHEAPERRKIFAPFQVDQSLFSTAAKHAVFMHCLPAHRGEEVTPSVIDSPRSVVFDQAENRLHIQKAIMVLLLEGGAHRFPPRSAHA
jgi:ornithine carbamoyltransferase